MKRRLGAAISALVLFSAGAFFFYYAVAAWWGWILCIASVAFTALCARGLYNLIHHEGWSVVIDSDYLELPGAAYRSRLRDRIPLESISFVGLWPDPPAPSQKTIIHAGAQILVIDQRDLTSGTVAEIAAVLIDRAFQGEGRVVRAHYR